MRVLMINQFPLIGGGSGFYTKNIAKSLRDSGHSVCIIIPENTTKIEHIDGVRIEPVFFKYKENITSQLPFNFGCFTTHPRSNTTFNDYTEIQLQMYIKAFEEAIENVIKDFKPDVIHSGHIWLLSNIASKYNIPTIITSHGTDIIGYNVWERFHNYAEEAVDRCKMIIAISDSNNEQILAKFPGANSKVTQLRMGYDQSIFERGLYNREEILKELGIENKYKNVVLFSGRLVEVKGVDILLKAAKIYENKDTLTLIVGDGILRNKLEELSQELELKNVKFLGSKDQVTLNKLYNIANVSILSSRYEGLGLVVIESLACGTPVVVTDVKSMVDFITDDLGVMVEKENPEELAKGIINVLNNQDKYDREHISKYIRDNYSQKLLINDVIELYKSCL